MLSAALTRPVAPPFIDRQQMGFLLNKVHLSSEPNLRLRNASHRLLVQIRLK